MTLESNLLIDQCSTSQPTAQLRVILNDAVLPLKGVGACGDDPNGLCALDTVIAGWQQRIKDIDFEYVSTPTPASDCASYDCYGNYTLNASQPRNRNGRAPRSSES